MAAHHYLGFRTLVGESLKYVAEQDGSWLALLGWGAAAFKCGPRDRWIGWTPSSYRPADLVERLGRQVGSSQGAVRTLRSARFPGPPSEPDARLTPHPALHEAIPPFNDRSRLYAAPTAKV
ncbi:MAG: Druantia anti-phage system protein DruA [Candidatus Dormibacteria bacterium]